MRKATLALIVSVLALAMAMPAAARAAEEPNEASQESSARGVSLGLLGGVNWQINDGDRTLSDLSEAYGFFVDIPIISTFYIAPEALIYRINFIKGSQPDGEYGRGITELTLNFKFILPLGAHRFSLGMRGGAVVGAQAANDFPMSGHFGAMAGYDFNFLKNLGFVTRVIYDFVPIKQGNLHKLFALIGLRFTL